MAVKRDWLEIAGIVVIGLSLLAMVWTIYEATR
jgi:hypothetical protein